MLEFWWRWGGERKGVSSKGLKWMLREQMGLLFFLYAVKGVENKSGAEGIRGPDLTRQCS